MGHIEIGAKNIEANPKNIDGGLKIVKVRDVVAKLVDDTESPVTLDDEGVNDMIESLMSEDLIDKEGNKRQATGTRCGDTVVNILDNHYEKFVEAMKHVSHEELHDIKEQIRNAIHKDPLLDSNLDKIGIDLDNFENYLGSVEVLTIERRRIYNVYKIKEE